MNRKSSSEKRLRKSCLNTDALVSYNSLCREWREALCMRFGNPPEKAKESYFESHYFADREARTFYQMHRFGKNNTDCLAEEKIDEDALTFLWMLKTKKMY